MLPPLVVVRADRWVWDVGNKPGNMSDVVVAEVGGGADRCPDEDIKLLKSKRPPRRCFSDSSLRRRMMMIVWFYSKDVMVRVEA